MSKAFTREQQIAIWKSQGWCCAWCGCTMPMGGDVHHRKPRSLLKPGENCLANGVGLCRGCHEKAHKRAPGHEPYMLHRWEEI